MLQNLGLVGSSLNNKIKKNWESEKATEGLIYLREIPHFLMKDGPRQNGRHHKLKIATLLSQF